MSAPEPTPARKIAAAFATALIVAAIWWIIRWRSALPIPGL
ncbi:MAG: hypothetical protein ABIZ56_03925 [Chthoniobacteraceae bacterium]